MAWCTDNFSVILQMFSHPIQSVRHVYIQAACVGYGPKNLEATAETLNIGSMHAGAALL